MAVAASEDFEGQPDGTAVTEVNTSASQVSGSMVFDTDAAIHNSSSGLVSAQTAPAYLRWDLASMTTCWVRGYFVSSRPEFSTPFGYTLVQGRSGATAKWRVYAQAEGNLFLEYYSTGAGSWQTIGTTGFQVLDGQTPFRVEVGSTSTTLTLNAYYGDNVEGIVADETLSGSYSQGAVDQVRVGMGEAQPVALTMSMDDIVVDDASNPGTAAGIPVFDLSTVYETDKWDHRSSTCTVDATASDGTVTLVQVAGPAVTPVQSPAKVFTVVDPGVGGAPIAFDVVATSTNGVSASKRVVLTRGGRAARLVLIPGGAASDPNSWR